MSELKSCLIGDVAEIIGGGTPSTKNEENFGGDIAWITPKDLSDHDAMYISKGERSITSIGLENSSAKLLPANSILFTSRAPIGYVALAKNEIATNQGFKSLVLKDDNDPKFFYYLLKNITPQIKSYASGSTFQEISGKVLSTITIKIPSANIQKRIGEFIEEFDKKIELNKKTNDTLEGIAQSLFKSWFIDFDPVRAKAEGRSTGLPDEISYLFPDSFEQSELGQIPKGWSKTKLSEIAFLNPESWSSKNYPEKIEYLDLSGVKNGNIQETNDYLWLDAPSRAKRILHIGDTIIGTVRPGNRSFCLIQREGLTGSTGFAALRPKDLTNAPLLYLASTTNENIQRLAHLADGGAYPAVKPEVIVDTSFVLPDISIQKIFGGLCSPIFCKVFENKKESSHLSTLRNTLIPKLISGEVRIPDAEKMIDEVGI